MVTLKHPQIKSFIKMVKEKCKENNVELKLIKRKKLEVEPRIYAGGYFQDLSRKHGILACATNNPEYLNLLVHEFGHMEQWIENTPIWGDAKYASYIDEWLSGKEINNIEEKIDRVKFMELDCEKRAVKNIQKYNLPINISEYIKKANSYILFYTYLKQTRKWCKPGNTPYSLKNKSLWNICPDKIMPKSYYNTIPPRILKQFIKNDI